MRAHRLPGFFAAATLAVSFSTPAWADFQMQGNAPPQNPAVTGEMPTAMLPAGQTDTPQPYGAVATQPGEYWQQQAQAQFQPQMQQMQQQAQPYYAQLQRASNNMIPAQPPADYASVNDYGANYYGAPYYGAAPTPPTASTSNGYDPGVGPTTGPAIYGPATAEPVYARDTASYSTTGQTSMNYGTGNPYNSPNPYAQIGAQSGYGNAGGLSNSGASGYGSYPQPGAGYGSGYPGQQPAYAQPGYSGGAQPTYQQNYGASAGASGSTGYGSNSYGMSGYGNSYGAQGGTGGAQPYAQPQQGSGSSSGYGAGASSSYGSGSYGGNSTYSQPYGSSSSQGMSGSSSGGGYGSYSSSSNAAGNYGSAWRQAYDASKSNMQPQQPYAQPQPYSGTSSMGSAGMGASNSYGAGSSGYSGGYASPSYNYSGGMTGYAAQPQPMPVYPASPSMGSPLPTGSYNGSMATYGDSYQTASRASYDDRPLMSASPAGSGGVYVALRSGFSLPQDTNFSDLNGNFVSQYKTGWEIGGALGYQFPAFSRWFSPRLEIEASDHRASVDKQVINGASFSDPNAFGTTNAWRLFGNGYLDFATASSLIKPYIGGGIGVGIVDFDRHGTTATAGTDLSQSATGFAYNVGAGLSFNLAPRTTMDVGYRYSKIMDLDLTALDGTTSRTDLGSHEFIIGLRQSFGGGW
ncbi:MAG TPA: outer membrane beta-barrel protein [Alphaproteobacteria bacterium]|nr:outer membrane beta-barrel protein [Alphaproteobacteria bacterium]